MNGRNITFALSLGIAIIPLAIILLFKFKRRTKTKDLSPPSSSFTNVLFFPDESLLNAKTLLDTISSSRQSLDVCVYCLTNTKLIEAVTSAHSNGAVVRIITDNEEENMSKILQLRRVGIQVRTDRSSFFMHHKFAVIDGKTLLNGSLNWTTQAMHGNQENVIITDRQDILYPFIDHFEKLWQLYDITSS